MMKRLILTVGLWFLTACAAGPGFEAGHAAHERGDFKTAFEILLPLAQAGDASAQVMLGTAYASGNGMPQDAAEADKWFGKAAQSRIYKPADIAALYQKGDGVPKDVRKAIVWYEKGADEGDPWALYSLGAIYESGEGAPVDYDKAFTFYTRSVSAGGQYGHGGLAEMYRLGKGRPVDIERAVLHLKAVAAAGDSRSMWLLGDIHGDSAGESADLEKAEAYYLRSARAGNVVGMNKLALFYRMKAEKPRQALKWWLVLFRKGVVEAAYSIGYLYHDGLLGGQPEKVEALAWFRIGLEQGVEGLKPLVNTLESEFGPYDLAQAERRKRAIKADLGL